MEQLARDVFVTFGFGEIRLPIFEKTDLFARSVGQETDIVSKEMYTFEDRSTASFSLPRSLSELIRQHEQINKDLQHGDIPRRTKGT